MSKKIISVGIDYFPGDEEHVLIDCASYKTHVSLADADIIILTPGPTSHDYTELHDTYSLAPDKYLGKICLSDNGSGIFHDDLAFWKKEIDKAIESGKTIFILSEKPNEFYYATGKNEYSGTGKNQKTTRIVDIYSSYSILPIPRKNIHASSGSEITYRSTNPVLRTLWEENKDYFHYQVCYEKDSFNAHPIFFQKKGKDVLGGIVRTTADGFVVVLPALELEHPDFIQIKTDPLTGQESQFWTKKAMAFTNRFVKGIVEIDKALKGQNAMTPAPSWTESSDFAITEVLKIDDEIFSVETEIEKFQKSKVTLLASKDELLLPRRLLYETGKPLENAVKHALACLDFTAESFQDSESEFDVVFKSMEGSFLGEVEGKDTKAIDVTKISQLMRNLGEYLTKDNVDEPAKGVLFGNGYRLLEPKSREIAFTDKCIKVSVQSNIALVKTSDLFPLVQYLNSNPDENFKKNCREVIFNTKGGIVIFPTIPKAIS